MARIKKVLNSSVVILEDGRQSEMILLQKGVGYGSKPGQEVEIMPTGRIFRPEHKELEMLEELLEQIEPVYLEAASLIVEYAQAVLGVKLNPHVYLALTDHLHFAVERQKQNLNVVNRVFWEIKSFYPREFRVGEYGLKVIKSVCKIVLPPEEAANIAFHIINAQSADNKNYDVGAAAKIEKQVLQIVLLNLSGPVDKDSIHYSRFMTHLQFFVQRLVSKSLLTDTDPDLYSGLCRRYPQAMVIASKVRTFLESNTHYLIPDEEVCYLGIHIQRLMTLKN